ncbi:MAG: DNA polymerase Y family protein, partial [Gemmatimonadota bacterium]|nr:DNA polymerase Y family protein [Gemmatimonadota bacterium]
VVVSPEKLPAFLAASPVHTLPVNGTMLQRLERLGIRTLKDLLALPEPALVAQFGEEGRSALAWAAGRRIDPVRPRRRPEPVRVSMDFPVPVGMVQTLHGSLDRLVERALSRPGRRGRSVVAVRLSARLEGGGSWTVDVVLREATTQQSRLAAHLKGKMAVSPPSGAVETLVLELTDFGSPTTQQDLFARSDSGGRGRAGRDLSRDEVPPSLREAARELKLRLGHAPLYRVVEVDPWSRIPERRHALMSFDP